MTQRDDEPDAIASSPSVVRSWVIDHCTWKEQTVLLCAMRGPDAGGSPEIKAVVRWLRRTVLQNAAPVKTFMEAVAWPRFADLTAARPLAPDTLPVHYLGHLMRACQVIGYRHPEPKIAGRAESAYVDLCKFLHVEPETPKSTTLRLADEVDR
jgi:hypothetical protein